MIALREREAPWAPSPDGGPSQTLLGFDGPLIGVTEYDGEHFLFCCVAGETEQMSLWVYAPLASEVVGDGFEGMFKSSNDLRSWAHSQLGDRATHVAVAINDGIYAWDEVEKSADWVSDLHRLLDRVVKETVARAEVAEALGPMLLELV
jgi:hypothetical protein